MSLAPLITAFLIGGIPFGYLFVKLFGKKDIRELGSKNIGATNVSRVMGFWPVGFLTFVFDFTKTAAFLALLKWYPEGLHFLNLDTSNMDSSFLWGLGFLGVLGHCFSPYLKFSGGKGVAATFGVYAILSPISAAIAALLFGIVFSFTKIGSLSSIISITTAFILHATLDKNYFDLIFSFLILWLIICKHNENLEKILVGKEQRF